MRGLGGGGRCRKISLLLSVSVWAHPESPARLEPEEDCWEVEYCGLQPLFQAGKTALPIKARAGHLREVSVELFLFV